MLEFRNLLFIILTMFNTMVVFPDNTYAIEILRMATTTSTENSGLLNQINPPFESKYKARVQVIAVGTGKAIRLAENGEADLILVHAPEAEIKFVNNGFGIRRTPVMHNDFVLLGPKDDPADVSSANNIVDAFRRIAATVSIFVSRGDDSGTHKKEKQLWEMTGIEPSGKWYLSAGQGMGMVIMMAFEKQAYVLSDRGTYLAFKHKIDLDILKQGDEDLRNPYHAILVNPEKYPHVNSELAKKYIEYLTGLEGQQIIADFRIKGNALFYPDVILSGH